MNEGSSLAAPSGTTTPATPPSAPQQDQGGSPASPTSQTADQSSVDMTKIFGEEFSKDPNLAKFKSPSDVVKSYKELQAMVGKPKFDVPAPDSPPEVMTEFYKKMGVPDNAEGYGLKPDAYNPDHNNETNAEFVKAFSAIAHEAKLTPAQAQAIHKFMDDMTVNVSKAQETAQAQEDAQLTSLFEKALPGKNLDVISLQMKADLEKVIPEEMRPLLANKMSNEALTALAIMDNHYKTKYGQSDSNIGGEGSNSGKSAADLRAEATAVMSSPAYQNPMDPGHKAAVDKANAYYKSIAELTANQKR